MPIKWTLRFLHYPWMCLVNQLLGLILLNEWFTMLSSHFFTHDGFMARIRHIHDKSTYNIFNNLFLWSAEHVPFLYFCISALILIVAIMMIIRVYRMVFNWIGVVIYAVYVLAHVGYPGTWLFENVSPFIFCLILAISTSKDFSVNDPLARAIGFHIPDLWKGYIGLLIAVFISILVGFCIVFSDNAGTSSTYVALETIVSFVLLYLISHWLNDHRPSELVIAKQTKKYQDWIAINWLDYCLIYIGVMLVCQVNMDDYLKWFSTAGYTNLIHIYDKFSHSPDFMKSVLVASQQHASWLAPLQFAFEQFFAFAAVMLIFRFPVVLGMFALFFILTVSEFGVPATWPPTPTSDITWTWELLNITLVTAVILCYQCAYFFHFKSAARRILGEPIFIFKKWRHGFYFSFITGTLIALLIHFTHALKTLNHQYMFKCSVSVFLFLLVTFGIDTLRRTNADVSSRQV